MEIFHLEGRGEIAARTRSHARTRSRVYEIDGKLKVSTDTKNYFVRVLVSVCMCVL